MRPALLITALLALGITPSAAEDPLRTITVSAQSEVNAVPDMVVIDFTIDVVKERLRDAKDENDLITHAAMQTVKTHEIDIEQVKVTRVNLSARHDRQDRLIGYGFTRSFEVRMTEFDELESLVSGLIQAGVQEIDSVDFRLRDQRDRQFEARQLAVEYAKKKATHLARLLDMKPVGVIHIEEDVEYNWDSPAFGGGFGGSVKDTTHSDFGKFVRHESKRKLSIKDRRFVLFQEEATKEEFKADKQAEKNLLLAPGLIQLNATVTIEFELEPIATQPREGR